MNDDPPKVQPLQDDGLAAFQAAMLELFIADLPPEEAVRRLQSDPAFASYRGWIDTFEPRMIETAASLVRKWAKRKGEAVGAAAALERG